MIAEAMVFLVLLIPNMEKPVISLMAAYPTVKECNEVLSRAPKDGRWSCIKIDLKPEDEREVKKA